MTIGERLEALKRTVAKLAAKSDAETGRYQSILRTLESTAAMQKKNGKAIAQFAKRTEALRSSPNRFWAVLNDDSWQVAGNRQCTMRADRHLAEPLCHEPTCRCEPVVER
jgi:hypothetical protein